MQATPRAARSCGSTTRRRFLELMCAAPAAALLQPKRVSAAIVAPRTLAFEHLHTGEALAVAYWEQGAYNRSALAEINQVLRDFRTGEVFPIATELLDLLHALKLKLGADSPYQVICGYRSPATNEMLRKTTRGVVAHSLHLEGRAIDVRLPGVRTARLWEVAAAMRCGGVGYYAASDFVHLDNGRPRVW